MCKTESALQNGRDWNNILINYTSVYKNEWAKSLSKKKKTTNIKKPESVGYFVSESSWFSIAALVYELNSW